MTTSAEWLIVIGGSAGSLTPLRTVIASLPQDLSAACLVVIHTSATGGGYLPSIMRRWTRWPVAAVDAPLPLHAGSIYIAAPDRHLKVNAGGVESTREVREHHVRPAVDVLFRSAARAFGPQTIAIVLSGYDGDGAAGALAVRARGGTVIVQDPREAEVPGMPLRTRATGAVSHVAPATKIGALVQQAISRGYLAAGGSAMTHEEVREVIVEDIREQERGARNGKTAVLSCPECGGVMWQSAQGNFVDFACHIGHRYTGDTLLVQKTEQLEAALVTALRLLKEKAILLRQTANRARRNGQLRAAERLDEQAAVDERYADVLQHDLLEAEPSALSNAAVDEDVTRVEGEEPSREADKVQG